MKYVFLINSFTVGKHVDKLIELIKEYSKDKNINYKIEINSDEISTESILEKYKNSKNIIIPIGGDGIINRTVNSIVNTNNKLGFIPYGTGNDFYRTALKEFKDGINKCDLIIVNDKYFINTMCFGIDADIAYNKRLFKSSFIPKDIRYTLSILYTFFKYKSKNLTVKVNDEIINDDYTTIAICNGDFYGGGYYISPNSKLNDGVLEVLLVPITNKLSMIKLILSMKKGKHLNSNKIKILNTSKIEISSHRDITANIDGEDITSKKFNIELIKNGIDIYFNKDMILKLKR